MTPWYAITDTPRKLCTRYIELSAQHRPVDNAASLVVVSKLGLAFFPIVAGTLTTVVYGLLVYV